ncbi:hypothetical protein GCM10020001_045500 [Nonomuraea salmonea]
MDEPVQVGRERDRQELGLPALVLAINHDGEVESVFVCHRHPHPTSDTADITRTQSFQNRPPGVCLSDQIVIKTKDVMPPAPLPSRSTLPAAPVPGLRGREEEAQPSAPTRTPATPRPRDFPSFEKERR